jgi:uncharacterized protein (DUF1778 family)
LLICEIFVATVLFMARPPKAPSEAKTDTLRIRLTEAERKAIDKAAASKSLETSTWARSELMALAKKLTGAK